MPEPPDPNAPPAPPAGAPAAPPAPPPAAPPGAPAISFPTQEAFDKRLQQGVRASLRDLGIENPKETLDELQKLRAGEEKRKKEAMTAQERLETEAAEAKAGKAEAERQLEAAKKTAALATLAASKGVKNVGYLQFKMDTEKPEDAGVFVDGLLKEEMERVALGFATAPGAPPDKKPATTSPAGTDPPKPPPAGGTGPEIQDAFALSDDDWAARKAEHGLP